MITVNGSSSTLSVIEQANRRKEEQEEKLASGKRINSAADDPAGLQIASRLTSQVNQDIQSSFNAQDQINTNQVQSGTLDAISDGLQRANQLSIQSGGALADGDAIQGEFDEIAEQVNTLAEEVLGQSDFLTGLDASDPQATQVAIEDALNTINQTAADLGAQSNALGSQVNTYQTSVVNTSASRSRIEDTDFSNTTAQQQQQNILLQSAVIQQKDEESRKGLLVNQII